MLMNVQMDGGPTRKKDNMSNSGLGSTFEEDDENNTRDPFAQLQSLQSTFSLNRRARPPPINTDMDNINRIPLRKELQKRTSRFGLQGMFTRTKTDIRQSIISPVMEETALGRTAAGPSKEIVETNSFTNPRPAPTPVSTPRLPVTPAKPTSKPSRINLRSKSVKEIKVAPKASPKSSLGKTPTRSSAAWDPPPLFQAYPQAIKHATLSASTLSADSILRMSNHRRNNSIVDDFKAGVSGKGPALTAAAKKTEKAKNKHRRQLSGSISKGEWTRKIYVLVTSGYLLQYAADGSFDRLPEKMMQLGKDSVAFASDVIPGKHWVLQISQSMDADGTPTTDSRSLFSRLAFRGADYRRTATSFLLVLNSAEDLDAWIAAVRREIEALGGKKNLTELGKPKSEEIVSDLKTQPSHRFLVQRESIDQFSNPSTPQSPSFGVPSWTNENLQPDKLADAVSAFSQAQAQAPFNRATDSHHSMTTMSSHDGHQLDALRESTNRFSHMSSGQRTFITTESSSPSTSPQRESFPSNYDETPSEPSIDDVRPRPNALAINERRRSMQVLRNQVNDPLPTQKFRPHSTYDIPPRPSRSKSPTPNFSVPRGSRQNSKSPNPGRTFRFPIHERPPVPTYVTQMPVRPRNSVSTLKSSQKAPPKAISVVTSSTRPSTSPKSQRTSKVMTPTETSFKVVPQARASVINIPPRSPSSQGSSPVRSRTRMSPMSDYPLNPPETLLLDFQFPRRVPSMQTLQEAAERSRSMRESTPPEAALSTPLPRSPYILGQGEQRPRSKGRSTIRASVIGVHPLPNLDTPKATPPKGLRRPSSMQYQPSLPPTPLTTPTSGKRPTTPNKPPFKVPTTSPPRSTTINHRVSANPLQRLRETQLVNRRSMPTLANGPPPAPPPDCALPPLPPPGSAGSMKSPGSSGSRDSVRV